MWKPALGAILFAVSLEAALVAGPERPAASPRYVPAPASALAVASDGASFLVLWGSPVRATIVAPDGTVPQGAAPIVLRGNVRTLGAVWTGQSYLVVGDDGTGTIFSMRLSASGEVVEGRTPILAGSMVPRQFACDGSACLLLYRPQAGTGFRLAVLDNDGRIGRLIAVPWSETVSRFALTAASGRFVLTWMDVNESTAKPDSHLYSLAVASSGEFLGAPIAVANFAFMPGAIAAASDGRNTAVVFTQRTASNVVMLDRVVIDSDMRANVFAEVPIVGPEDPDVVWAGREFAACWMNIAPTRFGLFAMPFSANRVVTALAYGDRQAGRPLIATTGAQALAVWTDYRVSLPNPSPQLTTVFGAVLDASLSSVTVGGTAGFPISLAAASQWHPSLASSGTDALLVWQEASSLPRNEIRALRLDERGAPVDEEAIVVATNADPTQAPAVTTLGDSYLVVWCDGSFVYGRRVHRDGTMDAAVQYAYGRRPVVASTASAALVGYANWDGIRTVSVDAATGAALPGYFLKISGSASTDYSLAGNGTQFLLMLTGRGFSGDVFFSSVWGWRFDASGLAIDSIAFPISNGWSDKLLARAASGGRDFLVLTLTQTSHGAPPLGFVSAKRVMPEGELAGSLPGDNGIVLAGETTAISVARAGGAYVVLIQTERVDGSRPTNLLLLDSDFRIAERADSVAEAPIESAVSFERGGATVAYTKIANEPQYGEVPRIFLRQLAPASMARQRAASP